MDKKVNYKELGFLGENIAGRFLESRGYKIIDRNYKKVFGEVDLIATKGDCVVFAEVKTKIATGNNFFNPELRVNRKKVSHINKVARVYLDNKNWLGVKEWQIDIVSVTIDPVAQSSKVKHFQNIASDIY